MQAQSYPQQALSNPYAAPMAQSGRSVMGVQLAEGERVVYFHTPNYTMDKVGLWVGFALTFWILIGFVFLYLVLTFDKKNPKAVAVTTNRLILFPGEGEPMTFWLRDVADLEPVRQNANGAGGGLLGAAIAAGVSAVANHLANKKAKTERAYWKRAIAVVLIDHSGLKKEVPFKDSVQLGMFLANGLFNGGYDRTADAPCPA